MVVAQPKAGALDLIAAGEKCIAIRESAKLLGVYEKLITGWLNEHGWVYRLNGRWVAKQPHVQAGRLIYKEARYTDERTRQEVYAPYLPHHTKRTGEIVRGLRVRSAAGGRLSPAKAKAPATTNCEGFLVNQSKRKNDSL